MIWKSGDSLVLVSDLVKENDSLKITPPEPDEELCLHNASKRISQLCKTHIDKTFLIEVKGQSSQKYYYVCQKVGDKNYCISGVDYSNGEPIRQLSTNWDTTNLLEASELLVNVCRRNPLEEFEIFPDNGLAANVYWDC